MHRTEDACVERTVRYGRTCLHEQIIKIHEDSWRQRVEAGIEQLQSWTCGGYLKGRNRMTYLTGRAVVIEKVNDVRVGQSE